MSILLPGQLSRIVDEEAREADLTDTGVLAVTARAAAGRLDRPADVTDMRTLARDFGPQVPWSGLHAYARAFFDRGGRTLKVQRYDGPAAAAAKLELTGAGRFFAISPGTEGNRLSIKIDSVEAGAARVVHVFRDDVEVERSYPVGTLQQLASWAATSVYVIWDPETLTGLPAANSTVEDLVGGISDHTNAGDAQRASALSKLVAAPGGGQLAAVDGFTDQARADLALATLSCNRHALLDMGPGATKSSTLAAESAIPPGDRRRYCQLWPQHAVVEQLGVEQVVAWSAVHAAKIATIDRAPGLGPHVPPAGARGKLNIDGLSVEFSESERAELNDQQINVARSFGNGVYKNYAWWSLADQVSDAGWVQATAAREVMRIRLLADPILENYVARGILPDTTLSLQGEFEGLMAGEQTRGAFDLRKDPAWDVTTVPFTDVPAEARWEVSAGFVPVRAAVRVEFNITNRMEA